MTENVAEVHGTKQSKIQFLFAFCFQIILTVGFVAKKGLYEKFLCLPTRSYTKHTLHL